jgi:hypothetical protein
MDESVKLTPEQRRALLWLVEAHARYTNEAYAHVTSGETWRDMSDVGVNYKTAVALHRKGLVSLWTRGDSIEVKLTTEGQRRARKIERMPAI